MRETFYKTLEEHGIPLELAITHIELSNHPTMKIVGTVYRAKEYSKETGIEFARRALPYLYKHLGHPQKDKAAAAALFSLGIENGFYPKEPPVFWALHVNGYHWWTIRTEGNFIRIFGPEIDISCTDVLMVYRVFEQDFTPWLLDEYGIDLETNLIRFESGQIIPQPKVKVWEI